MFLGQHVIVFLHIFDLEISMRALLGGDCFESASFRRSPGRTSP